MSSFFFFNRLCLLSQIRRDGQEKPILPFDPSAFGKLPRTARESGSLVGRQYSGYLRGWETRPTFLREYIDMKSKTVEVLTEKERKRGYEYNIGRS
jgi:hypothetical protein